MKEIVNRLHENRQIELAKSILESNGYNVSRKESGEESSDLTEAYKGLSIAPFREFTKEDFYGYAGAENIGNQNPLIFNSYDDDTDIGIDIIISGEDRNSPLCNISVYLYAGVDDAGYYLKNPVSFPKALRLGKEVAAMSDDYEKLLYWCEDNLESY